MATISIETAIPKWIEWRGGDCPVAHNTAVELRYREQSGRTYSEVPQALNWGHHKSADSIVGYRILTADEHAELRCDADAKREKLNCMLETSLASRAEPIGTTEAERRELAALDAYWTRRTDDMPYDTYRRWTYLQAKRRDEAEKSA